MCRPLSLLLIGVSSFFGLAPGEALVFPSGAERSFIFSSQSSDSTPGQGQPSQGKDQPASTINHLLDDLDSDRFQVREVAAQALKRLGSTIEPALRERYTAPGTTLEGKIRIQAVLRSVAEWHQASAPGWIYVHGGSVFQQPFRANGTSLAGLQLRLARLGRVPAGNLKVEVRDLWLDRVFARASISRDSVTQAFRWQDAAWTQHAPLTAGNVYFLLLHSLDTTNEAPWLIERNRESNYPAREGDLNGACALSFTLRFRDGKSLIVGPLESGPLVKPQVTIPQPVSADPSPFPPEEKPPIPYNTPPLRCRVAGHRFPELAFANQGKWLLSLGEERKLHFWDLRTGQHLREWKLGLGARARLWCVQTCAAGKILALAVSTGAGPYIRLWDLETQQEITARYPRLEGTTAAFSPDGQYLATVWRKVQVCDLRQGKLTAEWAVTDRDPLGRGAKFASDNRTLYADVWAQGGETGIRGWDILRQQCCFRTTKRSWSDRLTITEDGRLLAYAADNKIELWDTMAQKCLRKIRGHLLSFDAPCLSPDGSWLATGGSCTAVRLWSTRTGALLSCLEAHETMIMRVLVSPDGRTLVTADTSDLICIWPLADWIARVKARQP